MWTRFYDMHSGGDQKLDWPIIFIEAPEQEAKIIFENRFDRDPNNVTCNCCGNDYSISESESLLEATDYDRIIDYKTKDKMHIDEYILSEVALFIPKGDKWNP